MKRYMILLTAWLLCCAVQPLMNAMAEEMRMEKEPNPDARYQNPHIVLKEIIQANRQD